MASKNYLIAVAGGIGLACALTAGLAHLAGIGSNAGKSSSKHMVVRSGEHGPQSFPQLDADGTSKGSKGKNSASEGDEAGSGKQIVAQPARPDEPMSPDEYEPSELSKHFIMVTGEIYHLSIPREQSGNVFDHLHVRLGPVALAKLPHVDDVSV